LLAFIQGSVTAVLGTLRAGLLAVPAEAIRAFTRESTGGVDTCCGARLAGKTGVCARGTLVDVLALHAVPTKAHLAARSGAGNGFGGNGRTLTCAAFFAR
jgi:hypothetical protein